MRVSVFGISKFSGGSVSVFSKIQNLAGEEKTVL
jgi:hypothetical protein